MNVSRDDIRLFTQFALAAERADVSWELSRSAGWFVSGEHSMAPDGRLLDADEIPEEHRIPNERGYTMMVSLQHYADENGDDMLYPTIKDAAIAGLRLIDAV